MNQKGVFSPNRPWSEAKGMRLADEYFSMPVRQKMSANMVRTLGDSFCRNCRNREVGTAFRDMAHLIARQREWRNA